MIAEIGRAWFAQLAGRRFWSACEAMENLLSGYGRIRLIWPVCVELVKIMLGFFLAPDVGTLLVPQAKDSQGGLNICTWRVRCEPLKLPDNLFR
jgi:hypothetical protein